MRLFAITRHGLITIGLLVATLWTVLFASAAQERYILEESTRLHEANPRPREGKTYRPAQLQPFPTGTKPPSA